MLHSTQTNLNLMSFENGMTHMTYLTHFDQISPNSPTHLKLGRRLHGIPWCCLMGKNVTFFIEFYGLHLSLYDNKKLWCKRFGLFTYFLVYIGE